MQRQHLLAAARAEGDVVSTRRGLQRPEHSAAVAPVAGQPCAVAAPTRASLLAVSDCARRAVALRLDEPLTVADLCQMLGTSRRALQNCFQATWGMGLLKWLNTLRLDAERRRLRLAASVTEAVTEFGFWHFGRFAGDCRVLSDELPSQTLQRHREPQAHFDHCTE